MKHVPTARGGEETRLVSAWSVQDLSPSSATQSEFQRPATEQRNHAFFSLYLLSSQSSVKFDNADRESEGLKQVEYVRDG